MAENPTGVTTDQLLMGLGKVVVGLGGKMDLIAGKMDAIHTLLAEAVAKIPQAAEQPTGDSSEASVPVSGIADELRAVNSVLTDKILPALREINPPSSGVEIDLTPILEKIDSVTQVVGNIKEPEELRPVLDKLVLGLEQLPDSLTEKYRLMKEADTSNPLEEVEKRLAELSTKLDDISASTKDRDFVSSLTDSLTEIRQQMVSSGSEIVKIVEQIPVTMEKMETNFSGGMQTISEKTGALLEKSEQKLKDSNGILEEIKTELSDGLRKNTDMTAQMVELTSRFVDRAERDRLEDLNTRAVGHFNRGELKEAEVLFDEALQLAPDSPEILCNAAHLYAAMDRVEKAEKLFRKALEISPDFEPAVSGFGMLMVKTGRAEETIEFLRKMLIDGQPSERTVVAYTRALAAVGRHGEAVEMLESTLKAVPNNPDIIKELEKYGHSEAT